MRAAIFRNADIVVDSIADPVPSDGQVLVKTLCCGICGTDLHAAKHTRQFVELAQPLRPALGDGPVARRGVRP